MPLEEVLRNEDIIQLVGSGFGQPLIEDKIAASRVNFDLTAAGLSRLKDAGVSEDLLAYMMQRQATLQQETAQAIRRAMDGLVSHMPEQRKSSLAALRDRYPACVPYLEAELANARQPQRRAAAARALGGLGAAGSVEAVIPLLTDTHLEVCLSAAEALHQLGDPAATAAARQILSRRNERPEGAIRLLGMARDPESVLAVDLKLWDSRATVRREAARALGEYGIPDLRLDLEKALDVAAERPEVRVELVKALAKLRRSESLDHLFRVVRQETEGGVREETIRALAHFSPRRVAPFLINEVMVSDQLSPAEFAATTEALRSLTLVDFGTDRPAWVAWLALNREKLPNEPVAVIVEEYVNTVRGEGGVMRPPSPANPAGREAPSRAAPPFPPDRTPPPDLFPPPNRAPPLQLPETGSGFWDPPDRPPAFLPPPAERFPDPAYPAQDRIAPVAPPFMTAPGDGPGRSPAGTSGGDPSADQLYRLLLLDGDRLPRGDSRAGAERSSAPAPTVPSVPPVRPEPRSAGPDDMARLLEAMPQATAGLPWLNPTANPRPPAPPAADPVPPSRPRPDWDGAAPGTAPSPAGGAPAGEERWRVPSDTPAPPPAESRRYPEPPAWPGPADDPFGAGAATLGVAPPGDGPRGDLAPSLFDLQPAPALMDEMGLRAPPPSTVAPGGGPTPGVTDDLDPAGPPWPDAPGMIDPLAGYSAGAPDIAPADGFAPGPPADLDAAMPADAPADRSGDWSVDRPAIGPPPDLDLFLSPIADESVRLPSAFSDTGPAEEMARPAEPPTFPDFGDSSPSPAPDTGDSDKAGDSDRAADLPAGLGIRLSGDDPIPPPPGPSVLEPVAEPIQFAEPPAFPDFGGFAPPMEPETGGASNAAAAPLTGLGIQFDAGLMD